MIGDPWQDLERALKRWALAGRVADFWLRDDDAVEPTVALDRLLGQTELHSIPLMLAVIPAGAVEPLADRLGLSPLASVAVHGWAHENHAPASEKKQEFGAHRDPEIMLAELRKGTARLRDLFASRLFPLFVPPWNRIDPRFVPRLPQADLHYLSAFGPERTEAVRSLNTNIDIMDWRGTRGGRDHAALVADIVAQLERMFDAGSGTVGVLTHHLVHDEVAWDFLARLFDLTSRHAGCRWRSFGELTGEPAASL